MAESGFKKLAIVTVGGAVIVAGGIVGASALLRSSAISLKTSSVSTHATEKTITVKGVAEKEIISDLGSMEIEIFCNAQDIPGGYAIINKHNQQVIQKLADAGIKEDCFENIRINYEAVYDYIYEKDEKGKTISRQVFKHYRFTRSFRIVTKDVNAIEKVSASLYDLIANGVEISLGRPQYFISNPEQFKLELVDSATASAYQRANVLANKSGAELGPLLLARQGVIQITRTASNDTSDYGMYDTTSIKKVMRLVVTLEYSLKK